MTHRLTRGFVLAPLLAMHNAGCEWFTGPKEDVVWSAPHTGYSYARPGLLADTLFVATGDGRVIARLAASGAELWRGSVGSGRVWGGNIAVTAASSVVAVPVLQETRALDAHTGAALWTYKAPIDTVDGGAAEPGSVARVQIAAGDSTIYIPAWGGTVTAVHARTGAVMWLWRAPALTHRFGAQGVTLSGGTLFVNLWHFLDKNGLSSEARVVALDAKTGAELWQTVLPGAEGAVCLSGAPAVAQNIVAVVTITGRVHALDRVTGAIKWTVQPENPGAGGSFNSILSAAAASGDTVFADAGTGAMRALSAANGQLLWRSVYSGQFAADMTLSASKIYAPDGTRLHVLDRRTGKPIKRISAPGGQSSGLFPASIAVGTSLIFAPYNGGTWALKQ